MDLDGNGKTDMLSGSWPGEIYLFRRENSGAFSAGETLKGNGGPLKVGSASAVAAADWDADGDQDLLIGNIEGAVFYALNTGSAKNFAFGKTQPLNAGGKPIKVSNDAGPFITDWDADGKLDLLLGSGTGEIGFYRNIGTREKPELAAPVHLVDPIGHSPQAGSGEPTRNGMRSKPAAADWNGDGILDLLVGDFRSVRDGAKNSNHGHVWVYLRGKPLTAAK